MPKLPFADMHLHISLKHITLLKDTVWYSNAYGNNSKPNRSKASKYTQSDVKTLIRAGVDLSVVAIYALEDIVDWFLLNRLVALVEFGFPMQNIYQIRSRYRTKFDLAKYELGLIQKQTKKGSFEYLPVRSKSDLNSPLSKIVLSLEGGHNLHQAIRPGQNPGFSNEVLTSLRAFKRSSVPIFSLTLCHFQDNHLAGQAWALPLPELAKPLIPQTINLLQARSTNGTLGSLGKEVIRLALDENSGNRILIDLKHTNAPSRLEYYRFIEANYAQEDVPMIASHTGVSGISTLSRQVHDVNNDRKDEANRRSNGHPVYDRFNPWDINLCDEDIKKFCENGGMIGISLDQRILGGTNRSFKSIIKDTLHQAGLSRSRRFWHTAMFLENVFHVVKAADDPRIWHMLCIGSDNDGIIDPIDSCPTALHFMEFETKYCKDIAYPYYLKSIYKDKIFVSSEADLSQKLRRIFHGNLKDFVTKYFPV